MPLSNTTCYLNPAAVNIYYKETFYVDANFTYKDSLEILQNPANYGFSRSPVTSVGKLCDVIVSVEAFKMAVVDAGSDFKWTFS